MTTTIAYATSDGYLTSTSSSYTTAQAGAGLSSNTSGDMRVGQNKVGSTYEIYEAFVTFPYTRDTNQVVVAANINLYVAQVLGAGVTRDMGMRNYDWDPLTTADWRTVSQLIALTRYASVLSINLANAKYTYSSEQLLNDWLESGSGAKQLVLYDTRFGSGIPPTSGEYVTIRSTEAAGTSTDPCLVYSSIPLHTLVRTAGCQVQLSDGRHVYIEADHGGMSPVPNLTLKLHDGVSATNIATNLFSTDRDMGSSNQGLQQFALCRDDSDNIYWMGHAGGAGNYLNIVPWKKTGTSTWSELPHRQAAMPTAGGSIINNLAAAWHGIGGGTIMVIGSHESNLTNRGATNEMFYALVNSNYLLSGLGSMLRGSADALSAGLVTSDSNSSDYSQQLNTVATDLDVAALPGSNNRGVIISTNRKAKIGGQGPASIVRYQLSTPFGATLAYVHRTTLEAWGTKDAGAKMRVLPISTSRFVVVTLDFDVGFGPVLRVLQNFDSSSVFTDLGSIYLDGEGLISLPAPIDMHDKANWDAVYQADQNFVWFYYFDDANPQRLMKTAIDLNTFQAVRNEVQVSASVGVAGSSNHVLRVHRGATSKSQVLLSVANKTSGGTQSTIYLVDTLNIAPTSPTLVDRTNFDATQAAVFDWTFNDPNVGDTQTAYELVVENSETGLTAIATGKVASTVSDRTVTGGTLANGNNYRWRVRTWDTSDQVGAWSNYDFFTTSAGGTVTITNPASDNPPEWETDTVDLTWTTSGITQASYRIKVVRVSSGATISDTGYIVSGATSATVSGLASDVLYRIELTVRNASLVESNTALRLITPNYNEPETPTFAVTPLDDSGYVNIVVTNPTPGSMTPPFLDTFETDSTGTYILTNTTFAQSSTVAFGGSFSGKMTVTGTPTNATIQTPSSADRDVLVGHRYRVRARVYSPDGHTNVQVLLLWRDAAHATLGVDSVSPVDDIAVATWELRDFTAVAPAGAVYVRPGVRLGSSPPTGEILYVDDLEVLADTDRPEVTSNDVQRRLLGQGETDWVTIATIPYNGSYQDFAAGSGIAYEYRVIGRATNGFVETDPVQTTLNLQGVWLHVPSDPSSSIRNFRYGANQRGDTIESTSQLTHYAGRRDPVADFAFYRNKTISVTVDIPFSDTWSDEINAIESMHDMHETLVLRDNRRRQVFGIMTGLSFSDQPWGTQASFDFARVDFNEAVL